MSLCGNNNPCPDLITGQKCGITYTGARYVPLFADPAQWDNTKAYEPLTIVLNEGNSYTSKTFVPVGVDISNEMYWALTGNYNAQIEAYRQEVADLKNKIVNKKYSFDTVSDLKNFSGLENGDIAYTAGFNSINDGGSSTYYITSEKPEFGFYLTLNNLYAVLVELEPYIDQLNYIDDIGIIINTYGNFYKTFKFHNKTYNCSTQIVLSNPISLMGENQGIPSTQIQINCANVGINVNSGFCYVANLYLNNTSTQKTSNGINLLGGRSKAVNLTLNNFNVGIRIGNDDSSTEFNSNGSFVENIEINNCTTGLHIGDKNTATMNANTCSFNTISIFNCDNGLLLDTTSESNNFFNTIIQNSKISSLVIDGANANHFWGLYTENPALSTEITIKNSSSNNFIFGLRTLQYLETINDTSTGSNNLYMAPDSQLGNIGQIFNKIGAQNFALTLQSKAGIKSNIIDNGDNTYSAILDNIYSEIIGIDMTELDFLKVKALMFGSNTQRLTGVKTSTQTLTVNLPAKGSQTFDVENFASDGSQSFANCRNSGILCGITQSITTATITLFNVTDTPITGPVNVDCYTLSAF